MTDGRLLGLRLGIDIGGTTITALVTDSDSGILAVECGEVGSWRSVTAIIDVALALASSALDRVGVGFDEISAAGFALPGEVDVKRGVFRESPIFPEWHDVPISNLLQQKIGIPVAIENDANAALLAERVFGAARDVDSALLITIGTGIGGAILCDSQIIRGNQGSAGEIGHVSVETGGKRCWCGGDGCLGLYASTTALLDDYDRRTGSVCHSGREFTQCYLCGDPHAYAAIDRMSVYLARGIAAAVSVIAPEKVILVGGILDSLAKPIIVATCKHLQSRPYPKAISTVRVENAELGVKAGAMGASILLMERDVR